MTISSISSGSIAATQRTEVTSARPSGTSACEGGGDRGGTKLSKMGELVSQLDKLQDTDPAKAKEVLGKVAEALKAKADELGDATMSELANTFADAAESGDLSKLEPPKPHGPPPGPPPSGVAAKLDSYAKAGADPMAQIEEILGSALTA